MFDSLKQDLLRTHGCVNGGTIRKFVSCYRSPGVHATVTYRYGRWVTRLNPIAKSLLFPLYLLLYHRIRTKWGIEIPRSTQSGGRTGVVGLN